MAHVLISAHRFGAGDDLASAAAADFVEFDLQLLGDGSLVIFHDHHLDCAGTRLELSALTWSEFAQHTPTIAYVDLLVQFANTGRHAHIDLKFSSPAAAVEAAQRAVELLGPTQAIFTTHHDEDVAAIQAWAASEGLQLRVGLSLGKGVSGLGLTEAAKRIVAELFPARRFAASQANLVVAQRHLARLRLARWARKQGLPLMVWTVDSEHELRYWSRPGRCWAMVTNRAVEALRLRG